MNISLTSYIHQVTELMYVTNNGTTLAGVLSYYIYSQLYFHNNIRVKFHGVSGILEESLEALRDGLADFSGSPIHLDNKIDHLLLNRYNVGILGVNGWIECCLIHKALLNKPAISVLQTVFSTSKIFKHYIFSFLIVFLVISSLKDVLRVTLGLKFLKLFIQKYQPKNDYKKVSMFVLLVSLTLSIFLVSAFLITDCISLNEPQTLSDIKDLNKWKFTELVTVSGLCDNEVKFIVKQQGLENDYIQTDLEYINTASLTKNDAGLTLLAAYQSDFYTLFLLYCTKDYQDCLYLFFFISY